MCVCLFIVTTEADKKVDIYSRDTGGQQSASNRAYHCHNSTVRIHIHVRMYVCIHDFNLTNGNVFFQEVNNSIDIINKGEKKQHSLCKTVVLLVNNFIRELVLRVRHEKKDFCYKGYCELGPHR